MTERAGADRNRTRVRTTWWAVGTVAFVVLLGGCATSSPQPPVTTVTVYPDETTVGVGTPTSSAAGPSSVPTVTAPGASATSTSAAPTVLPPVRVGPLVGAPADFAQAEAKVSKAPAADVDATAVQSPSGNIYCAAMSGGAGVACEIAKGRAAAPKGSPCPGGGGAKDVGRVELAAAGAQPVCNSDTIRTTAPKQLAYGKSWAVPGTGFTCLSESAGVTCTDAANQHGFFITRRSYATF